MPPKRPSELSGIHASSFSLWDWCWSMLRGAVWGGRKAGGQAGWGADTHPVL